MKKLLVFILAITLLFTFASCKQEKCKNHADTSGDGICEECGKAAEAKPSDKPEGEGAALTLTEDGEATFKIVTASDISFNLRLAITDFIDALGEYDITVKHVNDTRARRRMRGPCRKSRRQRCQI